MSSHPDRHPDQHTADAQTLRALGHPVRLKLVDALLPGPLSATEAGEAIGETATTCSFHLRQLARYGLVEEHETGPGRRRTWRLTEARFRVPWHLLRQEGTEASMYESILDDFLGRARRGAMTLADPRERAWDEASTTSRSPMYLTRQELAELSAGLDRLLTFYRDRVGGRLRDADARPEGSRRVEVVLFAVPGADDADG
ncbi:ArsR/SmtB family transcription factor [Isoptericola sp. NPDC057559]|uniref:ArsR/SmtB family transcription factor n=1 Tax=Isoptericola sp. NPDC057559 TaxID=3346168 RepID=UPI0036D178DC